MYGVGIVLENLTEFIAQYRLNNVENKITLLQSLYPVDKSILGTFLVDELTSTTDSALRLVLMDLIGHLGDDRAISSLIDISGNSLESSRIRSMAMDVLGWLKSEQAIPLLVNNICNPEIKLVYRMISYDVNIPAIIFTNAATLALYRIATDHSQLIIQKLNEKLISSTRSGLDPECTQKFIRLVSALMLPR